MPVRTEKYFRQVGQRYGIGLPERTTAVAADSQYGQTLPPGQRIASNHSQAATSSGNISNRSSVVVTGAGLHPERGARQNRVPVGDRNPVVRFADHAPPYWVFTQYGGATVRHRPGTTSPSDGGLCHPHAMGTVTGTSHGPPWSAVTRIVNENSCPFGASGDTRRSQSNRFSCIDPAATSGYLEDAL